MADRPLPVLAWSSIEGDPAAEHSALFGRKFRRISRFVKLAQVAAARCTAQRPDVDIRAAGLFIGTGLGNTADIVPLAEGVLHPNRPRCSPMSFAGCLGNAASFFTARSLACLGPNVTISQEDLSFEAALLEATLALRAGDIQLAMVGGVDIISGDEPEQRERMNAVGAPGRCAQGAAFLLLAADGDAPALLQECWLGAAPRQVVLADLPATARLLPGWRLTGSALCHHGGVAEFEERLLPVATGLRIAEALDANEPSFVHLQRSAAGTWGRVRLARTGRV